MKKPSVEFMEKFHQGFIIFVGLSYILAGIPHFTNPDFYAPMMPPYLPWHKELILLSGLFEILGGVGMFFPFSRRFSSVGLIALLVAVFPANMHLAINEIQLLDAPVNPIALWARIPFQAVFIYTVWWAGIKEHPWQVKL